MKPGDRVKLVSMKEIEEASKGKFPGMIADSSGNCWLDVPDVKLGDIGVLGGCDAKGLFNCRFDHCTVCVNEAMVELLPCWTSEAPTRPGWYWYKDSSEQVPQAILLSRESGLFVFIGEETGRTTAELTRYGAEFWSEPIAPPKEEA